MGGGRRGLMSFDQDFMQIGELMARAQLVAEVRRQVRTVMSRGFVVTDGRQQGGGDYDVVVRCGGRDEPVARRLREMMPESRVERIAEDVLGVRKTRRRHDGD